MRMYPCRVYRVVPYGNDSYRRFGVVMKHFERAGAKSWGGEGDAVTGGIFPTEAQAQAEAVRLRDEFCSQGPSKHAYAENLKGEEI